MDNRTLSGDEVRYNYDMKKVLRNYFLQFQYDIYGYANGQRNVLPQSIVMGIAFLPLVLFAFIAKYGIGIFLYPFKVLANWFNK